MNKSYLSKLKRLTGAMLAQAGADAWLFIGVLVMVGPTLTVAFPEKASDLIYTLRFSTALLVALRAAMAGLRAGNQTVDDVTKLAELVEAQNTTVLETYALAQDIANYLKMSDVEVAVNDFDKAKLSAMRSEAPDDPEHVDTPLVYERPVPTQDDLNNARALMQKLIHGTMNDIRTRLFTLIVENMKLLTEVNQHRAARGLPPITEHKPNV